MIDRSLQPPLREMEEYAIKHPECRVLANGVKLYLLDGGAVEVTRIDLVFEAGKRYQDQTMQALFTNRMLREGTHRLNRAEIAEKLDFYGAWMDQNVDYNNSFITLYSLNKCLPQTIDLLAQMMLEPVFDAQALEVVKQNNIQRHLVSLRKTSVQARRQFNKMVYGTNHLYGMMAEEDDYQAINRDVLVDFYQRQYHSGNLSIYLSGHITDACVQLIEQTFGHPFGQVQACVPRHNLDVTARPAEQCFIEMKDSVQSTVVIGKSTISLHHPDCQKLRVLITLLGGYFGSRLMTTVREEKGYTYGIFSMLNPTPSDNALMILSDCAHEFVQPLIDEVYHQIDLLQQVPVGEDELAIVRSYLQGDLCRTYDSGLSIADAWIYAHTQGLPDTCFHDYWQAIVSVTPAELQRLACTYLCKESLTEVVAGQKKL